MSKQDFDDFIDEQVKKQNEIQIDWDKKRDDWLIYVDKFFNKIEGFLDEYKKSGKLSYQYSEKTIFEEYIGMYPVKVMDIKLGEHKVKLEPIGTNIISADGRIDLIGANGKVKFVLVNKNYSAPSPMKVTIISEGEHEEKHQEIEKPEELELTWKIATPPPRIRYENLEEGIFFDALLEVIGG